MKRVLVFPGRILGVSLAVFGAMFATLWLFFELEDYFLYSATGWVMADFSLYFSFCAAVLSAGITVLLGGGLRGCLEVFAWGWVIFLGLEMPFLVFAEVVDCEVARMVCTVLVVGIWIVGVLALPLILSERQGEIARGIFFGFLGALAGGGVMWVAEIVFGDWMILTWLGIFVFYLCVASSFGRRCV